MLDRPDDGIPKHLKLSQATRAAAWAKHPPRPMPAFQEARTDNLTQHDRDVITGMLAAEEGRTRRKTEEGLAQLQAWKDARKADEIESLEVLASAQASQNGLKTSQNNRLKTSQVIPKPPRRKRKRAN